MRAGSMRRVRLGAAHARAETIFCPSMSPISECGTSEGTSLEPTKKQRIYLAALLSWLLLSVSVVLLLSWRSPVHRAVVGMGLGLVFLWVVLCGSLMWHFRYVIRKAVQGIRFPWPIKFVLFCTLLALVEEAITTSMTNLAPLLGVRMGEAYITASGNYLDVIALHGVSLFVSFFVGWSVLLWRYDFSPFAVFVLFGITGTLIEMLFGGWPHVSEWAMWSCVYGLMVWLPAGCVPKDRGAKRPRWWHYPLAVLAPCLFVFAFPLLGVISQFYPNHPRIHFPPIQ